MEDALGQFNKQVERFVRCSQELHDALGDNLADKWAAGKLWALHSDVAAGCWQFADAYERTEHQRVVVATKALIFFMRGYQDGLAGAAKVASGDRWGTYRV